MAVNCPSVDRLAAWLEDALPARERASIRGHLAECDDCRRTLALAGSALGTTPEALDPASVDRWMRSIRRPYARWWSYAAAAGVLVAIAALLFVRFRPTPPENVVKKDEPSPKVVVPEEVKKDPAPKIEEKRPEQVVRKKHKPPPGVKPEERVVTVKRHEAPKPKHESIAKRETKVDLSGLYEPLALVDGTGDLWMDASRVVGHARAGYGQLLESRGSAGSFTVEGSATVALEPKSRAWVARLKRERAYALALEAGLAFVDTEGLSQSWQFVAGTAGVLLPRVQGRLFVKKLEDTLEIHVLQGRVDLAQESIESGRCLTIDRDGKTDLTAGDASAVKARLMRLREIRPAIRTAFLATFDEGASRPFAYSVRSGKVQPSKPTAFLRSEEDSVATNKSSGRSGMGIRLEQPVLYLTGMMLRFKYRASTGSVTIRLGKYSGGGQLKDTKGQWKLAEFPVELFKSEGVQIVSGETLDEIWIGGDRLGTLEVDDVELVRSAQFAK